VIKVVFGINRREGMALEDFLQYWGENHAALVKEVAQALNIRRYIQTHPTRHALATAMASGRGCALGFDGIAELWWDSADDLKAASPEAREGMRRLLEDEKRFMDLPGSVLFLGEEHPVL